MVRGPLRLRSRFFLSFGAILMLGAVVAVGMLVMMLRSTASYKRVLETDRRVAELALTIRADKLRISEALRGRLLHPYGDFGDQEVSNLGAAYWDLAVAYSDTRKLARDPALVGTLDQIENIDKTKLGPLEQQILEAIGQQESAEAETLYFDQYLGARTEQEQLLDQLNKIAADRISASEASTARQSRWAAGIGLALILAMIVTGLALSYYLSRSFEMPINRLMDAARAIAGGDLTQKLTLHRSDELGDMATVLNQMVTNLQQLNLDLGDRVRRLQEARDELAETQGQLVTQEKMAALGRLVAGVAHELNNPISFVYSNTVLLKDTVASLKRVLEFYDRAELPESIRKQGQKLKEDLDYDYLIGDIAQAIEDSHEGARRVRDIVLNLRTFSRLDDSELQTVDLGEGIDSTVKILGQYYRPDRVKLHRDYRNSLTVECYAGQLSQVWMNLLVNAAQAMNSKGDVWVSVGTANGRALVTIKDNGPGIASDVAGKIFDPFFTTKPVGEGTGLGLSICHSIIERHGGDIRVHSAPGAGTTFTVELPLSPREAAGSEDQKDELACASA